MQGHPETMPPQSSSPTAHTPQQGQSRNRDPVLHAQAPPSLLPFLNNPDFKRLVAQQVDFVCKQAVKSGRIRVLRQNPTPVFIPRMDIVDDPSCPRFVATFEIPGVRHDEVTLQIQEGSLVVDGERRMRLRSQPGTPQLTGNVSSSQRASSNHKVKVPIQELRYGRFRRLVGLPPGTKSADIVARFQDGMLIVTWPRSPASDADDVEMVPEMTPVPQPDSNDTPIPVPSSDIKQEAST